MNNDDYLKLINNWFHIIVTATMIIWAAWGIGRLAFLLIEIKT